VVYTERIRSCLSTKILSLRKRHKTLRLLILMILNPERKWTQMSSGGHFDASKSEILNVVNILCALGDHM
jgi:hypothetical protein